MRAFLSPNGDAIGGATLRAPERTAIPLGKIMPVKG